MVTDPNTLIAQANCFSCQIPPGIEFPVLISLAINIETAKPCVNLVPAGAIYNYFGTKLYLLEGIIVGATYQVMFGNLNDRGLAISFVPPVSILNPGNSNPIVFTATRTNVGLLGGLLNTPVTTIVCKL